MIERRPIQHIEHPPCSLIPINPTRFLHIRERERERESSHGILTLFPAFDIKSTWIICQYDICNMKFAVISRVERKSFWGRKGGRKGRPSEWGAPIFFLLNYIISDIRTICIYIYIYSMSFLYYQTTTFSRFPLNMKIFCISVVSSSAL